MIGIDITPVGEVRRWSHDRSSYTRLRPPRLNDGCRYPPGQGPPIIAKYRIESLGDGKWDGTMPYHRYP